MQLGSVWRGLQNLRRPAWENSSTFSEYRQFGSEKPISQSAGFIVAMNESDVALELHRLESGEIMMTMRQLSTPMSATREQKVE
jgi:hypothetical protein